MNLGSVYEKDSTEEPGTVVSHDPAVGTKIVRGQNIDLVVSRGGSSNSSHEETVQQEKVHVPDVRGASLDVARSGIEGRGLSVGGITYQASHQAEGTVVSQDPSPDTELSEGASVDLVIASREERRSENRDAEIYREHGAQNYDEPASAENSTVYTPEENNNNYDVPSRESGGTKNR